MLGALVAHHFTRVGVRGRPDVLPTAGTKVPTGIYLRCAHTTSILVYMDTASTKSVRLDADVVDELKLVAARRKTTIKALIEQALYDSLNRLPETKRGKKSA